MRLVYTARALATFVTAVAMVLLYWGLHGLAEQAAYGNWQSYLYPVPIDGLVATAYLAVYALEGRTHKMYAWGVVLLAASMSATGQVLHAMNLRVRTVTFDAAHHPIVHIHGAPGWAPFAAVMPAVSSPIALHLAIMLSRTADQRVKGLAALATEAAQKPTTAPAPAAAKPPRRTRRQLAQDVQSAGPAPYTVDLVKAGPADEQSPAPVRPARRRKVDDAGPPELASEIAECAAGTRTVSDLARAGQAGGWLGADISNARKRARVWRDMYVQNAVTVPAQDPVPDLASLALLSEPGELVDVDG